MPACVSKRVRPKAITSSFAVIFYEMISRRILTSLRFSSIPIELIGYGIMLTMKAKYALKALIALAREESGLAQARAIAMETGIPHKFLEAILGELRARAIVVSRRGAGGGFRLARPAKDISVADVIRIIDGPLAPIRCASLTAYRACDDCPDQKTCSLHQVMRDVREAMSTVLDHRSIEDLARYEMRTREKAA
jgi:Rrf2 family protein